MRLIDADKSDEIIVFDKQNELLQCSAVRDYCERQREFLNKFPTIDAEPVRHARWVDNHCTACGMMPIGDEMWKHCDFEPPRFELFMDYCPNCGAKMDEVSE